MLLCYTKLNIFALTGEIMIIGKLKTDAFAALAPMAGVADRTYRELCRGYGAAYTVSELVSAKALTLNDKKSFELIQVNEREKSTAVQLFGCDPEVMARAAVEVEKQAPDFIDINMGCPAPKVAASGGGALLMKNPVLAADVLKPSFFPKRVGL